MPAESSASSSVLHTPDGRYVVVRGRLWRATNPDLPPDVTTRYRKELMDARRTVGQALKANDEEALRRARARVQYSKEQLGERGPVWWTDGTPDYNRHLAKNTPYAAWFAQQS